MSHQLPTEGALHEAVEEMLQFLLGLALLGVHEFNLLDRSRDVDVYSNLLVCNWDKSERFQIQNLNGSGALSFFIGAAVRVSWIRSNCQGECNIRVDLLLIFPVELFVLIPATMQAWRAYKTNNTA